MSSPGAEFRVLMSIFDHSDERGRKSHPPGLKLLMTETGYGKTAVSEALTVLQERGWITQTRKGSGTSGKKPRSTSWSQKRRVVPLERYYLEREVVPLERSNPARLVRWSEPVGPLERTQ